MLVSYNGAQITYDEIGNPLGYYGGRSFNWSGRQMASACVADKAYSFGYNSDGLRTLKQGTTNTVYCYDGNLLVSEEIYQTANGVINENTQYAVINYFYDASGSPIGFRTRKSEGDENVWKIFFYEKNTLGDIVRVYSQSGAALLEYTYDAWGNYAETVLASNAALVSDARMNSLFYRGYYYDKDLGLYYLGSRYYDANTGRFISPDDFTYLVANGNLTSYNLYAYCSNNPVNSTGLAGNSSISVLDSSVLTAGSFGGGFIGCVNVPSVPGWLSTAAGIIPDLTLGVRYLASNGMHSKFAYATDTRYMNPIVGGTWRWFGKSSSSFGTITQGTFKQILTGDAKAGLGAVAKSVGGVIGVNVLLNFGFNFYENNWQVDSAMLVDTAIDTAIGVSSYYLAAGAMSLVTAGLLSAGVALPGIVVVGGVVILSIGFEHTIRAVSSYWS